jgi:acyl carrier protein
VSVRDELLRFLAQQGIELPSVSADTTPLFETGQLDSQALFNLVLWTEERIGEPIDPTALDLTRDWATVSDIVRFVGERDRRRG